VHPLRPHSCKTGLMLALLRFLSALPTRFFHSGRDLLLENLALRQQLAVLRRKRPQPRFAASDRLFWVMLRRLWGCAPPKCDLGAFYARLNG